MHIQCCLPPPSFAILCLSLFSLPSLHNLNDSKANVDFVCSYFNDRLECLWGLLMRAFPCERAQGKCSSDEINITIVGVPGAMCSPVRSEVCEWCHKWRVRVFLVWNDKVFALWILVASSTLMYCYTYDATRVRTRCHMLASPLSLVSSCWRLL